MNKPDENTEKVSEAARKRQKPVRDLGRRLGTKAGYRNAVGARVRERRIELGLSVDQVHASLVEVTDGEWNPSRQQVQHIEARRRAVTDLEVIALASVLKCGSGWLLEGTPPEGRSSTES